jgi:hypothetical protein
VTKYGPVGTVHIGVRPATNLFHAVRFAASKGRPLNLAVTINWQRLGLDEATAIVAFRSLRQKVRRRWTHLRKSSTPALGSCDDVAVHENPNGLCNTHWMIHVPLGFSGEFKRTVARFLKKVVQLGELSRGLHFQSIGAAGMFAKYVMKGVDPAFGAYFHVEPEDQGFVPGRGRTSVSRTIGSSARKEAFWQRKRRPRTPANSKPAGF